MTAFGCTVFGRSMARRLTLLAGLVATLGGCSSSPTTPSPPVPNPPAVVTPPTIKSVTTAATRVEVDQDVTITADVEDAEKPVTALTFVWSANAGTFSGTGPSVTWRLPKSGATTPVDVVISLTVVEPYQALENGAIVNREHRVTRQAQPFRAHDSRAEISKMVTTFLVDYFGDITVSPDACVVDFSSMGSCAQGKAAERADIADIRANYEAVTKVEVDIRSVTFNGDRTFAEVFAPCVFRSTRNGGTKEAFRGNCELTAVYETNRWWLCTSRFNDAVAIPTGTGDPAAAVPGPKFPSFFR